MTLKQVLEVMEILDNPKVNGLVIQDLFYQRGYKNVEIEKVEGNQGSTEFVRMVLPGTNGKIAGGDAPTLGIIGQLGGVGAFPDIVGMVSDGDGAVVALASALKLVEMLGVGNRLTGDVIITTHICPNAPIRTRRPVAFMDLPVPMEVMNKYLVDTAMDAILSVDTTKGNKVLNRRGFGITATVKEGYILKVSDHLLEIMEIVTGSVPAVLPITMQDITPYGNGIHHINSIMQPAVNSDAPVVGVAISTEVPVAGCATGASNPGDLEMATRFCIEVAKYFGSKKFAFYDVEEFAKLVSMYGSMKHLFK